MNYDLDAEREVIGSCMTDPLAFAAVSPIITHEHFFLPVNQLIYAAIADRSGQGYCDVLSVIDILDRINRLKDAGGKDYILNMVSGGIFIQSAGIAWHAARLYQMWVRRQYMDIGKAAEDGESLDLLKMRAESINAKHRPSSVLASASLMPHFVLKNVTGVSTGFPALDQYSAGGGYPSGQITIVSAYHKAGKTAWMLGSAINASKEGRRPLYATFADLGGAELLSRAMRQETTYGHIPQYMDQVAQWDEAMNHFKTDWPIHIYDAAGLDQGYDLETFASWFEHKHKTEEFTEVYVDYAQELHSRDSKALTNLAEAEICASLMARMARKHQIPISIGSQITEGRMGERDKTKGSRVWEEKAGWVLRLKRSEEEFNNDAACEIAFSRFGPRGSVKMRWNPKRVRYEEV